MTTEEDLLNALIVARNYIGITDPYKCGDIGAGQTMRRINDAISRAEDSNLGRHPDPIIDAAERAVLGI